MIDKYSDYGGAIGECVMKLINQFSDQDHSGASAGMVRSFFADLSNYKILSPLTAENSQWKDHDENGRPKLDENGYPLCDQAQSKRLSSAFKSKKGMLYLGAITFVHQETGNSFHGTVEGIHSTQFFEYPFMPKSFRINVKTDPKKDEYLICNKDDLAAVWRVYKQPSKQPSNSASV